MPPQNANIDLNFALIDISIRIYKCTLANLSCFNVQNKSFYFCPWKAFNNVILNDMFARGFFSVVSPITHLSSRKRGGPL